MSTIFKVSPRFCKPVFVYRDNFSSTLVITTPNTDSIVNCLYVRPDNFAMREKDSSEKHFQRNRTFNTVTNTAVNKISMGLPGQIPACRLFLHHTLTTLSGDENTFRSFIGYIRLTRFLF